MNIIRTTGLFSTCAASGQGTIDILTSFKHFRKSLKWPDTLGPSLLLRDTLRLAELSEVGREKLSCLKAAQTN